MLILLVGPPLSGQSDLILYLLNTHQFTEIQVSDQNQHSDNNNHHFENVRQLDSFILKENRWQQHWVVTGIAVVNDITFLRKRPYVLVVAIDAPLDQRWARLCTPTTATTLHDPVHMLSLLYPEPYGVHYTISVNPDLTIIMDSVTDKKALNRALDACQFTNELRLRPNWDLYFISLCHLASNRSNCMKRRVGCIIVSPTNRVLSTGYNGTPRNVLNCNIGGCDRCNSGTAHAGVNLDACLCMHAEENALLEIGRSASGATLFCTTFPCLSCAKKIVQCGIISIIYDHAYTNTDDGSVVISMFKSSNISLRQVSAIAPELPKLVIASQY